MSTNPEKAPQQERRRFQRNEQVYYIGQNGKLAIGYVLTADDTVLVSSKQFTGNNNELSSLLQAYTIKHFPQYTAIMRKGGENIASAGGVSINDIQLAGNIKEITLLNPSKKELIVDIEHVILTVKTTPQTFAPVEGMDTLPDMLKTNKHINLPTYQKIEKWCFFTINRMITNFQNTHGVSIPLNEQLPGYLRGIDAIQNTQSALQAVQDAITARINSLQHHQDSIIPQRMFVAETAAQKKFWEEKSQELQKDYLAASEKLHKYTGFLILASSLYKQ